MHLSPDASFLTIRSCTHQRTLEAWQEDLGPKGREWEHWQKEGPLPNGAGSPPPRLLLRPLHLLSTTTKQMQPLKLSSEQNTKPAYVRKPEAGTVPLDLHQSAVFFVIRSKAAPERSAISCSYACTSYLPYLYHCSNVIL